MDLRETVVRNRPAWERLESLMAQVRSRGLSSLQPPELKELGLLHRKVSADLATARTFHGDSRLVGYLNDLALRSHNMVYRAPRRTIRAILSGLWNSIPAEVQRHRGALAVSTGLFLCGVILGAVGTILDESVANMILGSGFVERIRSGDYLAPSLFGLMPRSISSAGYVTNNVSVALNTFAFGVTGVIPAWLLFLNGNILGIVFVLCGQYGILGRFLAFVIPHGIIEISAILLAGAGGLTTFDGWLHPGDGSRSRGLRNGAREGLMITAGAIPALLVAAFVEGFISPSPHIPPALRIGLGVALGLLMWAWLFGVRQGSVREDPAA
jgi:uncharacterized membrane protein SpoIIM required for sporulation